MTFSVLGLGGHIGSRVSALVDGQLSSREEEQAWQHVLTCPGCRRLVEREGWTKTRVSLSAGGPPATPQRLLGALYDVDAWATVDELESISRRRRTAVALAGAGSVGIAVLGLVALTSPPAGRGEVPGATPSPAVLRSGTVGQTALGQNTLGQGAGAGAGAATLTGTGSAARLQRASR